MMDYKAAVRSGQLKHGASGAEQSFLDFLEAAERVSPAFSQYGLVIPPLKEARNSGRFTIKTPIGEIDVERGWFLDKTEVGCVVHFTCQDEASAHPRKILLTNAFFVCGEGWFTSGGIDLTARNSLQIGAAVEEAMAAKLEVLTIAVIESVKDEKVKTFLTGD